MYFSSDSRVAQTTRQGLLPKVADNFLNSNPIAFRMVGNAKKWIGRTLDKSIKYQNTGTVVSFQGLDTFVAQLPNTKVTMSYDMRGLHTDISVAGLEVSANQSASETQVISLVKETIEEKQQELIDGFGTQTYGTGTGNSGKDLVGFGATIDDGTDVATIGNLSRTTYPVLNATRTAATGGVFSLSSFATLYTAVSSGSILTTPTFGVSPEAVWDIVEQTFTPQIRTQYAEMGYYDFGMNGVMARGGSQNGLSGKSGFVALQVKGIPLVRDEKATTGNLFLVNDNWVNWYGASVFMDGYEKVNLSSDTIEGLYDEQPMNKFMGLGWSGFKQTGLGYYATSELVLLGNFASFQPRRLGRLTGITTV